MSLSRSWLDEAAIYYNDDAWLNEHIDDLFEKLTAAVDRQEQLVPVVDRILLIYPYTFPHDNVKRWTKLVKDAAIAIQERYNSAEQVPYSVEQAYLMQMQRDDLAQYIEVAIHRARKRLKPATLLETYITLLRLRVHYLTGEIDREVVFSALKLAKVVNDQHAYMMLYQTLAFLYNAWGEFARAIEQAQSVYRYWQRQNNHYEAALSAYATAVAYTRLDHIEDGLHWLDISAQHFAKSKFKGQYALIAFETGNVHYQQQAYEAAAQWWQIALDEAVKRNYPPTTAVFRHALGMVQIRLGDYAGAEDNLKQALDFWRDRDPAQTGHLYHTLAFLEGTRGNTGQALAYLDDATDQLGRVQRSLFIEQVQGHVRLLREAIENGASIGDLP